MDTRSDFRELIESSGGVVRLARDAGFDLAFTPDEVWAERMSDIYIQVCKDMGVEPMVTDAIPFVADEDRG